MPFKAGMNLRSLRRPGNRRLLMGAAPNLATHIEDGVLPAGHDWAAAAADTAAWAARRVAGPVLPAPRRTPPSPGRAVPVPRPATVAEPARRRA